jgi:hypothetical protein
VTRRILYTFFILIIVIIVVLAFFPDSVYSDIAVTLVTVAGGFAIFFQIHKENTIAEGDFVLNINNTFCDNEMIQGVYRKLKTNDQLGDSEKMGIIAYLTFFEVIYILIKKNTIDIETIDDLFRERFFLCVMNINVQALELVKLDYTYSNIYHLNDIWLKFLKKNGQMSTSLDYGIPLREAQDVKHR